jgi:hypothetical protein
VVLATDNIGASGDCCASVGVARASAGQDLVGDIDHGPGSNQPVHNRQMAVARRSVKRSLAVLRCEARQEVKRESLCFLCQASSQRGLSWGRVIRACMHALVLVLFFA